MKWLFPISMTALYYLFYIFCKFVDKICLLDVILTSLDVDYTFLAKITHFWYWFYTLIQCRVNRSDNPMKPKDIDNWYYHIMKVALRSKASNNSHIIWMEYGNTTFPIKESPCPRVAHVQPWRQIAKSPNTNNTNRSNLTYLNTI